MSRYKPHGTPAHPADVYAYFDTEGGCLYIGVTGDFQSRHRAHRRRSPWFGRAASWRILSHHSLRADALVAEASAIREYGPAYNVYHSGPPIAAPVESEAS